MVSDDSAVFLDTSVQIARFVHGPRTKSRIEAKLDEFDITVTGVVVRHEFHRRLIKEAEYLIRQLEKRKSLSSVNRHIIDGLGGHWGHKRKRNICLETIQAMFESFNCPEPELTERALLFLEQLRDGGVAEFNLLVDRVVDDSCCALGISDGFGDQCPSGCAITSFLSAKRQTLESILEHLHSKPSLSSQMEFAQDYISSSLEKNVWSCSSGAHCAKLGDLLIALESSGVSDFYTLNHEDSSVLCEPLQQRLHVCPVNADNEGWIEDYSSQSAD